MAPEARTGMESINDDRLWRVQQPLGHFNTSAILLSADKDMLHAFALALEQRADAYEASASVALHWTHAFLRLVLTELGVASPTSHATHASYPGSVSPVVATITSVDALPAASLSVRKRIEQLMH